jgi:hypothetical protein
MIKRIIKILFFSLLAVVFIGSSAIAQGKGKGQGQSGDRPAGWDNGQKKGWQSEEVPPGQEEKEKKAKTREKI